VTSYPAIEALERAGVLFRRPGLRKFAPAAGADRPHDARLATAAGLLRAGLREAAEAGLSPAELHALTQSILKENP
jgi:GntR family transcriptional regulator